MAIRFDNVADSLSRTTLPALLSPFTWMTWVYVTSDLGAVATFLSGGSGSQKNFSLDWQTGSELLRLQDAAFGAAETGTIGIGDWHHVALVRTSTPGWISYLDGVQDSTLAAWSAPSPASDVIRVGLFNGAERLDGRVEAMKLWTGQLTAPQILAEMARYDPVVTANNWAWWPLTAHTDVTDHSVNARHWTANGTLTTEAGPGGIVEGGIVNTDRLTVVGAGTLAGVTPSRVVGVVTVPQTP